MKKAVWTAFVAGLVIVNGLAWLAEHFTDVSVPMPYRLTVVLGITLITLVFAGAAALVSQADEEVPLTRNDNSPSEPDQTRHDPDRH
ncbi:MAG: hypothetical protein ACQETO_06760 [Pseudomonadota bacterium]